MAPSIYTPTAALVAWLEQADLTVGNHSGGGLTPPYVVVYVVPEGEPSGPVDAPDADGSIVWQLTSVGEGAEQALLTADRARSAVLGRTLVVPDRRFEPVRLVISSPSARRDEDVTPPVFYCVDRVSAWSYPS